jgi:hypothetical protein
MTKTTRLLCSLLVVGLAMATAAVAPASAGLITPVNVYDDNSAHSDVGGSPAYPVDNLLSSTGLWATEDVAPDYFDNGGQIPVLTFDLGNTYYLTELAYLGHGSFGPNNISEVDVSFSTTGTGGPFSNTVTLTPTTSTSLQEIAFGGTYTANAVRLTVTDNHGGPRATGRQVQFEGTIIPEPSTFVLSAFGLLALIGLRRRK